MSQTAKGSQGFGPRTGAGYMRLETPVTCLLTRFRLRSAWYLPWMWLAYLRIRREARQVKGLLRTAFLIENPRVCFVFSIWADDRAVLEFGTRVEGHVHIARRTFQKTFDRKRQRAEVWSTQWRLCGVSNNLSWDDFDLRSALDEDGQKKVDEARIEPGWAAIEEAVR